MGSNPKPNNNGSSSSNNKVDFFINLYEASPPAIPPPAPTCTIELHIWHRYQLRIPSNEGVMILVEDILTPEWRTSADLPLLRWDLYLPGLFAGLNIDPYLLAALRDKVADAVSFLLAEAGTEAAPSSSFAIIAKVGILKNESLSKEETGRIAADFVNSPSPNVPTTDDSAAGVDCAVV